MLYINEDRINTILAHARRARAEEVFAILERSKKLQRLTLEETAVLLTLDDPFLVQELFKAASFVKNVIYGQRVVIFAPLYISNVCENNCVYCAFRADNTQIERKALSADEIRQEVETLLRQGHKRILMVAGEAGSNGHAPIEYYVDAVKTIYDTALGQHRIKRVNINCAPLSVEEFKKLKTSGIGTFQLFQETYHEATYRAVHLQGPKSDPDNRIDAIDRAFTAGIDDVGIGVLYGLYDFRFETLAMLSHIEHLEQKFKVGPHTISVPRIEEAVGSDFSLHPPYNMADEDFKRVVAVLRLAVPYTGIILSTRESPEMRDSLFNLGISQVSAGSNTSPGGYSTGQTGAQFSVHDHRSLDEVIEILIEQKNIPSFCAACYRKERTGKNFMDLARPGLIKGKCSINGFITLKEYLDDFASPDVKAKGYALIDAEVAKLCPAEQKELAHYFEHVSQGVRDEYV